LWVRQTRRGLNALAALSFPSPDPDMEAAKMKKFVLTATCLLLGLPGLAGAQDQSQYIELLRQDVNTQKTAMLTEAMDLDAAQFDRFWPIVREYDLKRAEIVDRRIATIKKYAANYETMTPDMADEVIEEFFKVRFDMLKLKKDYFGKVSKEFSAVEAARFLQIENFVDDMMRVQVMSEIPLIQHGVSAVTN
jgi:hypothetical protein